MQGHKTLGHVNQYKHSVHMFEEILNIYFSFNMCFEKQFSKSKKIKFIITSNS